MTENQSPPPEFGQDHNEGLQLPPWERRARFGLLNALYLTIKDVLLTPGRFFHRMPSQMGLTQPLLFALVLGVTGTFIAWMYSMVSTSLQMAVFGDFSHGKNSITSFFLFLSSPIWVAMAIFVQAGLTHGALLLIGGGRLGFEATFRVAAYSEATSVLLLVPICGSQVAIVWSLVILIIGLYSIHEIEPWKAVVSVLAPMLICLSIVGGSVIVWMTLMS